MPAIAQTEMPQYGERDLAERTAGHVGRNHVRLLSHVSKALQDKELHYSGDCNSISYSYNVAAPEHNQIKQFAKRRWMCARVQTGLGGQACRAAVQTCGLTIHE